MELEVLNRAALDAAVGGGRVVTISGPAGIGKTRLLEAAETFAHRAGHRISRAQGVALERPLAFGVVQQLLGDQTLPTASSVAPADQHSADAQVRLASQVAAAFRRIVDDAAGVPLAVLIDDAHWADVPSLRFIEFAARRVAGRPILLVVAARPAEPGADDTVVSGLVHGAGATAIEPHPLSVAGTESLLTSLLKREPATELVEACQHATGGNPLLLRELARALRSADAVPPADQAALVRTIGPKAVVWSVRSRLEHLPASAPLVAAAIAVLAGRADIYAVSRVAGVPQDAVREIVTPLERAQLIVGSPNLQFVHPLVRQAVLADLPASARARMHLGAAEVLAGRAEPLTAAAHLLRAAPTSHPWAVNALRTAAADAHRRGDPLRALAFLDRAVEADPRPALLADRAFALAAAGDDAAVAAFTEAAEATDESERAVLLLGLSSSLFARGDHGEAAKVASSGLALESGDETVRAGLTTMRALASAWSPVDASDHLAHLNPERPPQAAQSLLSYADRAALATAARRRVLIGTDHAEAADMARRAWGHDELLAASTADDPARLAVLTALHHCDALTEAREWADACLADARDRGLWMMEMTVRNVRGHVLLYAGDLAAAEPELRECYAARAKGWGAYSPVNAALLAFVLVARDQIEQAESVLDTLDRESAPLHSSPMWAFFDAARGHVALARGRLEAAATICAEARLRFRDQLGTTNPAVMLGHGDAALALHALARGPEAVAFAQEDVVAARAWGAPRALGTALRVLGTVGDESERLQRLHEAVDVLRESDARLERAHALFALGIAEDRNDAPATLREALDLAAACGAHALIRRVRDALVASGGRPRRARVTGVGSLTESERQIADLAASGLSTSAIADQLVITPSTVGFHLTNVYRKLGISGRKWLSVRLAEAP